MAIKVNSQKEKPCIINITNSRYEHFSGLPQYKIEIALLLSDICENAEEETLKLLNIDKDNQAHIIELCLEIRKSQDNFSEWMKNIACLTKTPEEVL